jgi:hypothetical protein
MNACSTSHLPNFYVRCWRQNSEKKFLTFFLVRILISCLVDIHRYIFVYTTSRCPEYRSKNWKCFCFDFFQCKRKLKTIDFSDSFLNLYSFFNFDYFFQEFSPLCIDFKLLRFAVHTHTHITKILFLLGKGE